MSWRFSGEGKKNAGAGVKGTGERASPMRRLFSRWIKRRKTGQRKAGKRKAGQRSAGQRKAGQRKAMGLEELRMMIRGIFTTREDEIGCEDCFRELDAFAEKVLAGKDAAAALPLVQDHLNRCKDCREEYELLLEALRKQLQG
jgi:hypothetical protein